MSFIYHWCLLVGVALSLSSIAWAEATGLKLTLGNAGTVVRAQSPSLAAARYRIGEARGRLRQSGLLTNPEAETSFQHDPVWREFGAEVSLSQDIPVTARLRHEKEVSLAELQAAEAEVADLERRLIGKVREALVRILALQAQKTNRALEAKVLQEILTFIESQVAKGEASSLDAHQVKVERAQVGLAMRQLELTRMKAIASLKPLLGVRPQERLLIVDELPGLPTEGPAAEGALDRPDLQAAAHLATAAEREVLLERAKRYDDLSVGFFLERAREEDAPDGLEFETMVGVRVSFPIPFWNKNEGAIEEKTAKHLRLTKELEAKQGRAEHESSLARLTMTAQQELLTEIETALIPEATKQVNALREAYQQGLVKLPSVLRARRQVIALSAARIDALRDYHHARVQLETALALP